jgi:chaperone required for assembly of F1-ATPase
MERDMAISQAESTYLVEQWGAVSLQLSHLHDRIVRLQLDSQRPGAMAKVMPVAELVKMAADAAGRNAEAAG